MTRLRGNLPLVVSAVGSRLTGLTVCNACGRP
jgi:hypothetical protein